MAAHSDWDIGDPTPSRGEGADRPERTLWCEVIRLAVRDARDGDCYAQHWLNEPCGMFSQLCGYMGLPSPLIRDQMKRMHRRDGRAN